MKRKGVFAGIVAVIFIISVAFAAGEMVVEQHFSTFFALCFNGLASIGSVAFLAKRYMATVDRAGETIPALVATLTAMKEAMERHGESIKELYNSRDCHDKKLTKIETVHELRGCNKNIPQAKS